MVELHKMSTDQNVFYNCHMRNTTMNITIIMHNYKRDCKMNEICFFVVDGQGLANNYDIQMQGQTN